MEGKKVQEIQVVGLKRIELDAVLNKIKTKKGEKLQLSLIETDISEIYKMGYFDDIEVTAENVSGGLRVQYELRERPVISKIIFEGNEQIDTDDLQEVVKVKEWSILDINRVREDTEKIQKHYEERGYYLAKVGYELSREGEEKDEITLRFKINDYDKVQIKKITILNNKVFSDRLLKKILMETSETSALSALSGSGNFKESSFKQDLTRLTYWYLDNGYIKFRYENPVVTVSDDKKWLYISLFVEEGLKYSMGKIDFEGDLLFDKSELAEAVELTEGKVFKISQRNLDIQALTDKYQDLGYAFANVIPKMDIDDEKKIVNITYVFEKGPLVYFGEFRVLGNTKTHDEVIRRELRVQEGELYHGSKLRQSKARVERLGFFEPGSVVFNTLTRKDRQDIVDIEISIKERSTGTVTVGAGYGSVQKFFLTAQISEINLFGRGQTLSLQGQWAADNISRSLNLGFTNPYMFDTFWTGGFDVFVVNFNLPGRYLMRKKGFDLRAGYPFSDLFNAFITYKLEHMELARPNEDITSEELAQDLGFLSSVIWTLVRDNRNNRFEPTDGSYQSASLETAALGGDKKFFKWSLNNRVYTHLVGDLVFRNSTEVAQLFRYGNNAIPPSERFFLGGPNNMKGFELFSLGPQDYREKTPGNFGYVPTGGLFQFFSLFEFEYPLIKEAGLKWVVFFDIGNSFSKAPWAQDAPEFTLRKDVGFGFRWFSPIGPLRFEWGFPLDRKQGESSPVFQFFIGPPF